jgi:hypothetical protein
VIGRHDAIVSIREAALGFWLRGISSYRTLRDGFLITAFPGISCPATIIWYFGTDTHQLASAVELAITDLWPRPSKPQLPPRNLFASQLNLTSYFALPAASSPPQISDQN